MSQLPNLRHEVNGVIKIQAIEIAANTGMLVTVAKTIAFASCRMRKLTMIIPTTNLALLVISGLLDKPCFPASLLNNSLLQCQRIAIMVPMKGNQ